MRTFQIIFVFLSLMIAMVIACGQDPTLNPATQSRDPSNDGLSLDATTGIPIAATFQHPIPGSDASDYGFGFGTANDAFCLPASGGGCEPQLHLARDTIVQHTPAGTNIYAPADGIVRVTTDVRFGGYGSDSSTNASYLGCAIVLEHLLRNGQAVTTVLGHLSCEAGASYVPSSRRGNPPVGSLVSRGQYVGHVGHYWHGADQSQDWHHLHWGMKKGRFQASGYTRASLGPYVRGYAPRSEFRTDPATGMLIHPEWLDPFLVVEANDDPVAQANASVRHHPSGSLLRASDGTYWSVTDDTTIASIPTDALIGDRYDLAGAVTVTNEEIACYAQGSSVSPLGHVTLYLRPGTNTVVMAYDQSWTRYDVINWEAFVSWGFGENDIPDLVSGSFYESSYQDRGFRRFRPGTLVKANEASEVAIVTAEQTRLPIASGDVFERAGFRWDRVVSIPQSVLDASAGPRASRAFTADDLTRCAVPPDCPGGAASCGGGSASVCAPDERFACMCDEDTVGEQACAEDGQSFLPCECPSAPEEGVGGAGGHADGGAGGSAGAPDPSSSAGQASGGAPSGGGAPSEEDPDDLPPPSSGGVSTMPNGGTGGESPSILTGGAVASGGVASSSGGTITSGGSLPVAGGMVGSGGQVPPPVASTAIHLAYRSPVAGPITVWGWWRLPSGTNIPWDRISACADTDTSDDLLACDLPVPSGSPILEFQVQLPDGRYWGDLACDSGGCGEPLGWLTLSKDGVDIPFEFIPGKDGPPYYLGRLMPVP